MTRLTAIGVAALAALGWTQAGCAAHAAGRVLDNSPVDESAIRRLEEAYREAKVKNDATALARIVAADHYDMNQNGNARNRDQLLELFKTFSIRSLDVDIERLRISGNNAVVAGRQREVRRGRSGRDCREIHLFLRTYVRRDGRWQLLTNAHYRDPNKGGPATHTRANDVW